MKKPVFSSPLVIHPDAKQRNGIILVLMLYLVLQGWNCYRSFSEGAPIPAVFSCVMIVLAIGHTVLFRRKAVKDVTAFLPSTLAVCGIRILYKLVSFFVPKAEIAALPALIAECLFWAVLAFCTVRAVCGKYKLIIPLLLLFFGFFYTFIKHDLRNFGEIASQICLFLLLWLPLDAVVFTSLTTSDKNTKE